MVESKPRAKSYLENAKCGWCCEPFEVTEELNEKKDGWFIHYTCPKCGRRYTMETHHLDMPPKKRKPKEVKIEPTI